LTSKRQGGGGGGVKEGEGVEAGEVEGWKGGGRGKASGGGCAFAAGCLYAYLAAALSRDVRATVPIPVVDAASVLHSAAVGGFDAGVVGPL